MYACSGVGLTSGGERSAGIVLFVVNSPADLELIKEENIRRTSGMTIQRSAKTGAAGCPVRWRVGLCGLGGLSLTARLPGSLSLQPPDQGTACVSSSPVLASAVSSAPCTLVSAGPVARSVGLAVGGNGERGTGQSVDLAYIYPPAYSAPPAPPSMDLVCAES